MDNLMWEGKESSSSFITDVNFFDDRNLEFFFMLTLYSQTCGLFCHLRYYHPFSLESRACCSMGISVLFTWRQQSMLLILPSEEERKHPDTVQYKGHVLACPNPHR